jgi:hypothetical protein
MPVSIVATVTYFGGFGGPRRVYVSVPFVSALIDRTKYFPCPFDEPAPPPHPSRARAVTKAILWRR